MSTRPDTHPRVPEPFEYGGRHDGGSYSASVALDTFDPLPWWRALAIRGVLVCAAAVGRRDPEAPDRRAACALRRVALRLTLDGADGLDLASWQDNTVGTVLAAQLRAEGLPLLGLGEAHREVDDDGAGVVYLDPGVPSGSTFCLRPSNP